MSKHNKNYHSYSSYSAANKTVKTDTPAVAEEVAEETVEVETTEEIVEETPVEVTPEPAKSIVGVVEGCDRLRVRVTPNVSADNVLCEIEKDSEVQINEAESTEDFYKVITSAGAEGFCMKKFITIK